MYSQGFDDSTELANRSTQTFLDDEEDVCSNVVFDPATRRNVSVRSSFRNRRRREEFDCLKFLMDKKTNQDYCLLEFQPDDELEEEMSAMRSSPDRKRIELLADGVLRRIAEQLEYLNRTNGYRMMDVHYEKHK